MLGAGDVVGSVTKASIKGYCLGQLTGRPLGAQNRSMRFGGGASETGRNETVPYKNGDSNGGPGSGTATAAIAAATSSLRTSSVS